MDDINPNFYGMLLDNLYDGVYFVNRDRRITFWNKGAERITGFSQSEVLGASCADNLLRHVDDHGAPLCGQSCPLGYTLQDGHRRSASVFLHHKLGHRVPVSLGITPIMDGQHQIIGAAEIFRDHSATIEVLEHLKDMEDLTYLDGLTRIANRTYLETFIAAKFNELHRLGWAFGVIFADVDHFKRVNDTFGHQAGDVVLKMVAQTLMKNCRSFDLVGRWGGEEFLCVLSNLEDPGQIQIIAERLRALVASTWVPLADCSARVTLTLGVTLARPHDTLETLIQRADRLLYRGKAAGRNCVVFE